MTALSRRADVVVVGGGVVGAATAFYLAESGAGRVVLLEAKQFANGATARAAGIVRSLHESETESRLAMVSRHAFANWRDRIGGDCRFDETGFLLMFGSGESGRLEERIAALEPSGYDGSLLTSDEVGSRFPQFDLHGVAGALYEPSGGAADPVETALSYIAASIRNGVEVHEGVRVTGIDVRGGEVAGVNTSRGSIECGVVVVASGVGAGDLLAPIEVHAPVLPVRMTTGQVVLPESLPLKLTFIDTVSDTFFRPSRWPGVVNVSIRDRLHNTVAPPARAQDYEPVHPEAALDGIRRIAKRLPAMSRAKPYRAWSGIDGVTPDYHPIVGPVAGISGLLLAVGGNFKSFKLAPAIGLVLTDLILGHEPRIDIDALSANRFEPGVEMGQAPSYTLESVL